MNWFSFGRFAAIANIIDEALPEWAQCRHRSNRSIIAAGPYPCDVDGPYQPLRGKVMLLGSLIKADFDKHGLACVKKPTLVMS